MSCFLVVSQQPLSSDLLRGRAAFVHASSMSAARDVLRSITPTAALISPDAGEPQEVLKELTRRGVPTIVQGAADA